MKQVLLAALLSITGFTAQATVLTFDDIPLSEQNRVGFLPAPYNGFTFNNTSNWIDTVGSGWNYGAHSGDFTLLNNYSGAIVVTASDASTFTFNGVWAQTWAHEDDRSGNIYGYNQGQQVFASQVDLTDSFRHFNGANIQIDKLVLDLGDYMLIDDLALNELPAASVPEPGSLALLGLGVFGLGAARRRNKPV